MLPSLTAGLRASAVPMAVRVAGSSLRTPSMAMRLSTSARRTAPDLKEEHRAHTISQRIRTLKKIPPELIPLGVVLAIAIGAAAYSAGMKFVRDKQLRLSRSSSRT